MRFGSRGASPRRTPELFTDDPRPGANGFVYCKGCGQPLESRDRFTNSRPVVTVMMCDSCREAHGHDLIPISGSATFCYRCGGPDEIFITPGMSPITHHVCPRCLPERAARFRDGNFAPKEAEAVAEVEAAVGSGESQPNGAASGNA